MKSFIIKKIYRKQLKNETAVFCHNISSKEIGNDFNESVKILMVSYIDNVNLTYIYMNVS